MAAGNPTPWHLIAIAALLILVWQIWRALYPSVAFYRSEFEEASGVNFPESGSFIFKEATFPDFHGDYVSCALFTVSPTDFEALAKVISAAVPEPAVGSECRTAAEQSLPKGLSFRHRSAIWVEGDLYVEWGVLSDGKTVFFQYAQT